MIRELNLPETADDPGWQNFIELLNRDNRDHIGGTEWDQDPASVLAQWQAAKYSHCRRWLAYVDEVAVGCAMAWWETRDDPDMLMTYVFVDSGFRQQGIGTALAHHVREAFADQGFTRALAGINTLQPGADALTGPGGAGAVEGSHPGVRMALGEGFTLTQAAVWSRYDVHRPSVDPGDALRDAQASAGEDYELLVWEGAAPEELLEGLAVLKQRMRSDMPSGEVEFGASLWDAERLRQDDEQRLRTDRLWRTAVRHRPTGTLVALNELLQGRAQPHGFVGQWDTIVLPEHRGRRLGTVVKAANILQVRKAVPEGVEINACNAAENTHMRSINRFLGFQPYLWAGTFQLVVK